MAHTDWYNQNTNRTYPFVPSHNSGKLKTSEILDCRFFIVNPDTTNVKVFLHERKRYAGNTHYTFMTDGGEETRSITFSVPEHDTCTTVWNTDTPDFYGYIVVK